MTVLNWILLALVVLVAALQAWVRLAPLPKARLEARPGPEAPGRHMMEGGFKAVIPLEGEAGAAMARLEEAILATPRTVRLGELRPGEGTYVTRSLVWGFPDITRVWQAGGALHVHGHLVFGRGDFGVNRRRIEGWLEAAGLNPAGEGAGTGPS